MNMACLVNRPGDAGGRAPSRRLAAALIQVFRSAISEISRFRLLRETKILQYWSHSKKQE
jgi:hypothetical protein